MPNYYTRDRGGRLLSVFDAALDTTAVAPATGFGPARPTAEELNSVWEQLEKREPDLWRRCYPRIYQDVGNDYYTPKSASRDIAAVGVKVRGGFVGESEQFEILWASNLARYRVPSYWVTADLVKAIMHTTPPLTLDWYNMAVPFPAMVFHLPKGSLVHPDEGDSPFVSFSRHTIGQWTPNLIPGLQSYASGNGSMLLFGKTNGTETNDGHLIHWNIPYDAFPTLDLTKLESTILEYEDHQHSSGWLYSPTMTHNDSLFGVKVAHLVFGLLLLMMRKPELVLQGSMLNRVKSKHPGQPPREFWTRPIVGHNYRIRKVSMPQGGTHASPIGHWVRGFWREQHYGEHNSLVKDVLIDPYWRGGGEPD